MKRIEINHNPHAEYLCWGVYEIIGNGTRSVLLAECLTEDIANKVKEALES